jgi:trans-2-enoyl-CoA reductase
MNDLTSMMASYERYRQVQAKINRANKRALFDALEAANITTVQVEFDGAGDSGQIGSVIAFRGEDRAELPETIVSIQRASWHSTDAVATAARLAEAIETVCYGYLEETHGGWENNDGAFGEFQFDLAERSIALEFNGRFTDIATDNHTF